MTKSSITRDELNEVIAIYGKHHIAHRMAIVLLAAMDSEPFAYIIQDKYERERGVEGHLSRSHVSKYVSQEDINEHEITCTPLYRHAQSALVQPVMFIDGDISSEDADKLAKVIREFNEEDESPLAKMARIIRENPHPTNECDMTKAQPAPVVPDELNTRTANDVMNEHLSWKDYGDAEVFCIAWNACRAAMLNGGKP